MWKAVLYMLYSEGLGWRNLVQKIPSYRILDLAQAIAPECHLEMVEVTRSGEKIREEMISASDACTGNGIGDYFVILPKRMNWELSGLSSSFYCVVCCGRV